jgi:hypothetical protein
MRMVRPAQLNKALRGRVVKTENAPRAQKVSDGCTKYDPEFLRGAIEAARQGDSVELFAAAYEGEAVLFEPILEAPSKNE